MLAVLIDCLDTRQYPTRIQEKWKSSREYLHIWVYGQMGIFFGYRKTNIFEFLLVDCHPRLYRFMFELFNKKKNKMRAVVVVWLGQTVRIQRLVGNKHPNKVWFSCGSGGHFFFREDYFFLGKTNLCRVTVCSTE